MGDNTCGGFGEVGRQSQFGKTERDVNVDSFISSFYFFVISISSLLLFGPFPVTLPTFSGRLIDFISHL